jgi:hypothetical protein
MTPLSELAYAEGSIGIRIRIEGVEWVSSATLTAILLELEGAFSEVEAEEALIIANELDVSVEDIENLDDLIQQWSMTLNGHAIQIERAAKGSLLVGGLIAAVSLWILEKTLGKTLEEAWGESEMHTRLKKALVRRRSVRATKLHRVVRELDPVEVYGVGTFELSAELRSTSDRLVLDVLAAKTLEEAAPVAMMAAVR